VRRPVRASARRVEARILAPVSILAQASMDEGDAMSDTDRAASTAARELSKLGASKGGNARASILSPAERSQIARSAVRARWAKEGKDTPRASEQQPAELPHSMFRGPLNIGNVELEGHVLSDLRRVLTQGEVVKVLTGGTDSSNLGRYLRRVPDFEESMIAGRTIRFRVPGNPTIATGYEAELLIEICDLYLVARDGKKLKPGQAKLAEMAEIIVRASAKVGIVALVDEATGYQKVRAKQALQLKLQAFIADEMGEWALMFPTDFWVELARLEGIKYSPKYRPLRWGKYVMAFVYDAVDPDVGKELRMINPDPRFKQNHHQWLQKLGRERVNNQIYQVIAIMKLCHDMNDFKKKFAHVFQKTPIQMELWEDAL